MRTILVYTALAFAVFFLPPLTESGAQSMNG